VSGDKPKTGRTREEKVSWSSDMAEGALPLGTVLFKVLAGATLEAAPVVEGPRVASSLSRESGLRGDATRGCRDGPMGRGGLGLDRLSRRCRKDE